MADIIGSEKSKHGNSLDDDNMKSDEEDSSGSAAHQGTEERIGGVRSPGGQSPQETVAESSLDGDAEAIGRATTSSSRTHKVMPYDMGLDDDSTDSEGTQEDNSAGVRSKRLGKAVESSVTDAALISAASSSSNISAVASKSDDIDPIPDPKTPSKEPGKREDRVCAKDSPDPQSACLVDTPPPIVTKTERKNFRCPNMTKTSRSSIQMETLDNNPPLVSATREQWACPRCTLLNRARALVCDMCQTANPALAPSTKRLTRRSAAVASGKMAADPCGSDDNAVTGVLGSSGDGFPADGSTGDNSDSSKSNVSDEDRCRVNWREYEKGGGNKGPSNGKGIAGSSKMSSHANVSQCPDWRVSDVTPGKRRGGNARGVEVFVGNRNAFDASSDEDDCLGMEWEGEAEAEEEDLDEIYEDECGGSEDYEDADWDGSEDDTEIIKSQIEERFTQSSHRNIPSRKRQRPSSFLEEEPDEICDLTGITEDAGDGGEARDPKRSSAAASKGNPDANTYSMLEEISDDDEVVADVGPRRLGVGSVSLRNTSGERKFRFFETVSDLRNKISSSIDFSALGAAPPGVTSSVKSYESRKRVRDTKAGKTKRSKRRGGKKASSSSRVRGTAARAGKVKGKGAARGEATAARPYMQPFGRSGGVPSASWIPGGVATNLVSSAGASRGRVQRQPFNHYGVSDDLVDESEVGGSMNWESAGRINLGGD